MASGDFMRTIHGATGWNLPNPPERKKEGPNSLGGACPGLREEIEKSCAANC
jgi:hypothetical protein